MPLTIPPLQELLSIVVTATSTTTSVATHGAAPTPTIGGQFTTTAAHPNVDIEVSAAYMYSSVAGIPSFHVMIDGVADANCQCEGIALCTANFTAESVYRKVRLSGLTPGSHTLSVFLKNSTAGTATFTGSAVNPSFVRVTEAP